jgi:Rps23 Pro-64 3,4-dihydroxylase Tpa1-like proline 4-hydroxylase
MKINKLYDDVYEIEEFLTEEELSDVYEIINNTPEEDWFDQEAKNENNTPDFWYGKSLYFKSTNVFDLINDKMRNLFESYSYYPEKTHLQRYKKGDFIKHHADQWIPDLPYYIGYGFCLYYNNDYLGGELDYPDIKITIKPKANSLYIHGGHIVHGSLPVLDDTIRYFSTVFIGGTEESPTILKKELFK